MAHQTDDDFQLFILVDGDYSDYSISDCVLVPREPGIKHLVGAFRRAEDLDEPLPVHLRLGLEFSQVGYKQRGRARRAYSARHKLRDFLLANGCRAVEFDELHLTHDVINGTPD